MKKYKIEATITSDLNVLELNKRVSETFPYWDEVTVKVVKE